MLYPDVSNSSTREVQTRDTRILPDDVRTNFRALIFDRVIPDAQLEYRTVSNEPSGQCADFTIGHVVVGEVESQDFVPCGLPGDEFGDEADRCTGEVPLICKEDAGAPVAGRNLEIVPADEIFNAKVYTAGNLVGFHGKIDYCRVCVEDRQQIYGTGVCYVVGPDVKSLYRIVVFKGPKKYCCRFILHSNIYKNHIEIQIEQK